MQDIFCPIRKTSIINPNKVAIYLKNKIITYQELDKKITFFQTFLINIQQIAIAPTETLESIILLFACLRQSVSLLFLHEKLPLEQQRELAKQENFSFLTFHELFSRKSTLKSTCYEIQIKHPSLFLTTSATTGNAKIVCLSVDNFLQNAKSTIKKIQFTSQDCWLLSLPLYHVSGLCIVFRTLYNTGSIYISKKNENILDTKATVFSMVPTQLFRFLQDKKAVSKLAKKAKAILLGGSFVSGALLKESKKLPIWISYGLTETCSQVLLAKPKIIKKQIFLGFPDIHCEIKLGQDLEVYVRGKTVFKGYLKNQNIYSSTDNEGWFPTGDLSKFSKKYGYSITSRKDLMFISGGENIYPEEIEKALLEISGISQAVVVPLKDAEFGHRPIAFICSKKSIPFIEKNLLLKLQKYKIPIKFFSLENFPDSPIKANRQEIKKFINTQNFLCKIKDFNSKSDFTALKFED